MLKSLSSGNEQDKGSLQRTCVLSPDRDAQAARPAISTPGEGKRATANWWHSPRLLLVLVIALQCSKLRAQATPDVRIAADYARAEALVKDHQWDDGLQILSHVLAIEPRNLMALNLAGIASAAKGDNGTADKYFKRSLAVDPHFLPALRNLSISEFNAGDYASAEKHLMDAQARVPNDPTVNLYLGQIAYRQQKYTLAAERLDRARGLLARYPMAETELVVSLLRSGQKPQALELLDQLTPSAINTQSQLDLGVALSETDSSKLAVPYLQAAFDRNPNSYDIGFDLALASVQATDYATAIKTIQDIIERGRDTSELEDLLADALAAQGEPGKAADAYRNAIALDPSDENNYLDFASLCIDQRALEGGMKVIALGLERHPDSERLVFMRGILNALEDKTDLAEKDFQQAAQLAPKHDFGAIGLGAVYLEKGNSEEAIRVTRRQLKQKPDDPSLLYLLGEALIASGVQPDQPGFGEAQHVLEESVKLNPGLCLPHVSLGSIYFREERYSDAAVQFEAARAIDPNENSAYSHLAVAYRHLKQPEKAREILKELQKLLEQQRSGTRAKAITSETAKPE